MRNMLPFSMKPSVQPSVQLPVRHPRSALLLTGCVVMMAFSGCDRIGPLLGVTGQVKATSPAPITDERLRVVLPKTGAEAKLGPVSRRGDVTVWQTLDGITLSFRRGVLIETRGLGDDLMSSDVQNTLAMLQGTAMPQYYPLIRSHLDGEEQIRFHAYQCQQRDQSMQQTRIGTLTRPLRRVSEHCVSLERDITNTYWLNQDGTVIKSRQWVRPDVGYMETEYMR